MGTRMTTVHLVAAARPNFMKIAPLYHVLKRENWCETRIVHTGQHYDHSMSDVFFQEMGIPQPDHQLGIGSGDHGKQTGKMLDEIERVIQIEKPDAVVIYGDTNSTLAGALAAAKIHIPVIHIEAGLRSFNKRMPEEVNRITVDHTSTLLYSPTKSGIKNLEKEGFLSLEKGIKKGAVQIKDTQQ